LFLETEKRKRQREERSGRINDQLPDEREIKERKSVNMHHSTTGFQITIFKFTILRWLFENRFRY